jgi:hypothetical protein
MGILSFACIIAVALVWFVPSSQPKILVSIDISKNTVVTNGVEFANVRFGSLIQRSYVGWFATEALVAGQWIESASQHPEVRMAMLVSPKHRAIYEMPIPREGTLWRVRWEGQLDYAEVSNLRKKIAKILARPFFRETLHIMYPLSRSVVAFGYSTNRMDF